MRFAPVVVIAVFVLCCPGADAAAQTGPIRSCYGKTSGQLRIIGANETCKSSETLLLLNAGEKGEKGEKGDPGEPGPAGPPGPAGGVTMQAICDTVFSAILDDRARAVNCNAFFGSAKFVFLTNDLYHGGLAELNTGVGNGLLGADAKCQRDALQANLPGTYKAWLSTSHEAVKDRMTHAVVPYVRTDLAMVAANWDEFASPSHVNGITLNAAAQPVSPPPFFPGLGVAAWTGSAATGETASISESSCEGWTTNARGPQGVYGLPGVTLDGSWSEAAAVRCDLPLARLICVGQ